MREKGIYNNLWQGILIGIIALACNCICDNYLSSNMGGTIGIIVVFLIAILVLGFGSDFFNSLRIRKKDLIYIGEIFLKVSLIIGSLLIAFNKVDGDYSRINIITGKEIINCIVMVLKEELFMVYGPIILLLAIFNRIKRIKNKELLSFVILGFTLMCYQLKIYDCTDKNMLSYEFFDNVIWRLTYISIIFLLLLSTYMASKSLGITIVMQFVHMILCRNVTSIILITIGDISSLRYNYYICLHCILVLVDCFFIIYNLCKIGNYKKDSDKCLLYNSIQGRNVYDKKIWKYILVLISIIFCGEIQFEGFYKGIYWTIFYILLHIGILVALGFGKDFFESLKIHKRDIKYFWGGMLNIVVVSGVLIFVLISAGKANLEEIFIPFDEIVRDFTISFKEEVFYTYSLILVALYIVNKLNVNVSKKVSVLVILSLFFGTGHLTNIFEFLKDYQQGGMSCEEIVNTMWAWARSCIFAGFILKGLYMSTGSISLPILYHFIDNIITHDLYVFLDKMSNSIAKVNWCSHFLDSFEYVLTVVYGVWFIYILWRQYKKDRKAVESMATE